MTETPSPAPQPSPGGEMDGPKLVYILYFISLVVGVTGIAGVIVAYLTRGAPGPSAPCPPTSPLPTLGIGHRFAFVSVRPGPSAIAALLVLSPPLWSPLLPGPVFRLARPLSCTSCPSP